jgi:predicted acyltransferase
MNATAKSARIVSMDQFRGYTVAGMLVVNFLGDLKVIPPILKHNNTYFSYADSIMPSFLFACGFSYRLTTVRRLPNLGLAGTYRRIIVRSLALVLVSLMMYGFDMKFASWQEMTADGVREFVARLIKAHLWEVLAIIGVTQLLILPAIAAEARVRAAALAACLLGQVALAYAFNYDFIHGRPNGMDAYWGAVTTRCWDGGAFGAISWAVPMLAGTLVYDLMARLPTVAAARRLLAWGAAALLVGYACSCLTRLYDLGRPSGPPDAAVVTSPIVPRFEALRSRDLASMLADPPFVEPPPPTVRAVNYWMMDKRAVTLSFILFATGFTLALYALFVLACDVGRLRVGLFRTFGLNALAAYVIHHMVAESIHNIVPGDSPLWWCLVGLAVFFTLTYGAVRYLETQNIFIRL